MSKSLVVFLHSAEYDRVFQIANLLLTASSMGRPCYLFLFYGALASFLDGGWDDVNVAAGSTPHKWQEKLQRAFEMANTPSLYDVVQRARDESGGLTVYACSTSVRYLDVEPAAAREKVDEIVGLASMLEIAGEAGTVLYV